MPISFQPVTRHNFDAVLGLQITPAQTAILPRGFGACFSLARAYLKTEGDSFNYFPRAIYHDEILVGYIMLQYDPAESSSSGISEFFIDHRFQRRGYGRAALTLAIEWLKEHARASHIHLLCELENAPARALYFSAGFKNSGRTRFFLLHV